MKAKFKIKQLASVDSVVHEVVHPKHGATGIMVKLAGPTHPVFKEALSVFRESEREEEDNMRLLASSILEWDKDAFDLPLTVDNALKVLSEKDNTWLATELAVTVQANDTFFQ